MNHAKHRARNNMYKFHLGLAAILIGFTSSVALAKAVPKPFTNSPITISGTLPGSGATCTGYAGTCLGGGPCNCFHEPTAVAKGIGPVDFFINEATGDATSSDGAETSTGCTPFLATAAITDTKTTATATLHLVGSYCQVSGKTPQTITGGYSVASETPTATGFGTITGSLNGAAISLKLTPTK
jgi:hypothetical protein